MPVIKYQAGQSLGKPWKKGEKRTVVVTNEAITTPYADGYGFEDDIITYTATVKDNKDETLPSTFEIDLRVNGTPIVNNQPLDVSVYNPTTGALSLDFVVPDDVTLPVGDYTIKVQWSTQIIEVP